MSTRLNNTLIGKSVHMSMNKCTVEMDVNASSNIDYIVFWHTILWMHVEGFFPTGSDFHLVAVSIMYIAFKVFAVIKFYFTVCKCYDIPFDYRVTSRSPRGSEKILEAEDVDGGDVEVEESFPFYEDDANFFDPE